MKRLLLVCGLAAGLMAAATEAENVPKMAGERAERVAVFEEQVYGRRPAACAALPGRFEVVSEVDVSEFGAVRKAVRIPTLTPRGETNFTAIAYLPKDARKAPAFVVVSLRPVDVLPSAFAGTNRNAEAKYPRVPLKEVLTRGFALVMFHHGSVFPDSPDAFDGLMRPDDGWGAISTWALAASRCLDWIETESAIDAHRVAVIGHSRGGKTAIWAGVTDTRFAMVIANDSGCCGARQYSVRTDRSEKIADITQRFPCWFAPNLKSRWAGKDAELPFEAHHLLALVAPRLLAVGSGVEDHWACPQGEETAVRFASRTWRDPCAVHYHCRPGGHSLLDEDWRQYMDFAAAHGWGIAVR